MGKRKSKSKRLPRANSAATPPGPWEVVKWLALEPQPQTAAEAQPPPRRRKGPVPGKVSRYLEADRRLYPEVEQRAVPERCGSITAAAIQLAEEDKVAGTGTSLSKGRRLAGHYFRDHP
jgi:hypothetical protein